MSTELVEQLRKALLAGDAAAVTDLQQKLAARGDEAIASLDSLLLDEPATVREGAADVLESIGSGAAYDELVEFALRHLEDPSRQTKLPGPGWQRLRRIGKPILPALSQRYDASLPFDTRLAMIFIAQQIGDPAGRPLIERALSESDPSLMEAAGEALGSVNGPGAYERLIELLNADEESQRIGAIRGFERLGDKAAVRPLLEALPASDGAVSLWSESAGEPVDLRRLILDAIDSLAGESFRGDANKIREWLDRHSL